MLLSLERSLAVLLMSLLRLSLSLLRRPSTARESPEFATIRDTPPPPSTGRTMTARAQEPTRATWPMP